MCPDAEVAESNVDSLLQTLNISHVHGEAGFDKAAIDQRHGGWINDFMGHQQQNAIFEQAWKGNSGPAASRWADSFARAQPVPQQWANNFAEEQRAPVTWADNFAAKEESFGAVFDGIEKKNEVKDWVNTFDQENKGSFADQFLQNHQGQEETEADWMKNWEKEQEELKNWTSSYLDTNWEDEMWGDYQKLFMGYQFQENNPYLGDPDAMIKGLDMFDQGNLPGAILALEAAVQGDKTNATAWVRLGQAQAENDQDKQAISALEQAVALDRSNSEALISLAVSHTNECQAEKTSETLMQWLAQNPKYEDLAARPIQQDAATRSHEVDPDVHVGLGLLYNTTWDYDKALECFKAALTVRPDDYALWNKFGATLANSLHGKEHAEVAIDAYWRALEKKPTYTRARSNLGISYMATNNYVESAKCFLGALSINKESEHLWDLLRASFQLMHRRDLVEKCGMGDVEAFRSEFNF
eukprot:TRINITY_DN691_c1_g2_i2.p1 TRINITY_DN691_c1_g2~~TRINITY_DN691_c1_g2_i2.p1  ORF type:complete len:470 (+),score=127.59 TRINITY_DN691_c1_g2_i2:453-1862(+)